MSHYFVTPEETGKTRLIRASIWDREYEFTTAPGVFSGSRLDLGTSVLLRTCFPDASARTLLDLGCGYGPIAVALATELPKATIHAVDVNELALELTGRNASSHGVSEQVKATTPDELEEDVTFDEIWSNPPIRIGKTALHELLLTWLPRLKPAGVAYLVVGKNLGADSLQNWLIDQGWQTERLASAKGFRVFAVTRP